MKKTIGIFLFFCIVIPSFFPFLLSSPLGKPFVIRYLENRFQGNIAIEEMHFTWKGPQTFKNVSFVNSDTLITIPNLQSPVPFWQLQTIKCSYHILDGTFTFPKYNAQIIRTDAKVQDHNIHVIAATPQGGSLNIQGKYLSKEDYQLNVVLQQIPTIAIAQFLNIEILPILLGPTVNLHGTFSQAAVVADLSSLQTTATLKGIIADGVLTLTAPLNATLRISDPLSAKLAKQIAPNILTEFSIKNQITLTIPSGSVQLPFSQLSISNAVVDCGQASLSSGETLHAVLSIFKPMKRKFDAWFTPILFSTHNGITRIERFDVLLDQTIHLCSWGEIRHDKLRMTLGVPSDTLKTSFNIETLSPNYVLTIPMRGTLQNPRIETGSALTKIAAMGASKHIPTSAGKIFGKAVNIFTQDQTNENIPQPHRPFPWEKNQ